VSSKRKNTSLLGITTQIKGLERSTIANVVEIGRLLEQAAEQCAHGEYEDWLSENFDWSLTTARRYRKVQAHSQSKQVCKAGGFEQLNMSLSAIYALTECEPDGPAAKKIIDAARKRRVTYNGAMDVIREIVAEAEAKNAAKSGAPNPPYVEDLIDPPIELLSDEVNPPESVLPPSHEAVLVPPSSSYDDWLQQRAADEPVKLLQRVGVLLRQRQDWAQTIEEVGPLVMREIINMLKAGLDEYNAKKAVKAKADAAEAAARPH
jgi:hypothetical protein